MEGEENKLGEEENQEQEQAQEENQVGEEENKVEGEENKVEGEEKQEQTKENQEQTKENQETQEQGNENKVEETQAQQPLEEDHPSNSNLFPKPEEEVKVETSSQAQENNNENLTLPTNISDSVNTVLNYFTDKIAEKISSKQGLEPKIGMQNGYDAVKLASENIADNIQPKSETMQQLEDANQEEIKGGKRKYTKTKRNQRIQRKKNNSRKNK